MKVGAALILFFCMFALSMWEIAIHSRMIEQVNKLLPAEQQFAFLGWHFGKSQKLISMHEQLLPESRDREKSKWIFISMLACLLGLVAVLIS